TGVTNNGIAITTGQLISIADINNGLLVYTPAANINGTRSLSFQVQDDGGTANGGINLDPSANTFTFNISANNDRPSGTDTTVTIQEDGSQTFSASNFGFSDPIDGNNWIAIKILTLPLNGSLTNNGVAVALNQFISISDINNGHLVYT